MRKIYSNAPINLPKRRKNPALKTLLVMTVVIALMFGIKLIYDPQGDLSDVAAMAGVYEESAAPDTEGAELAFEN